MAVAAEDGQNGAAQGQRRPTRWSAGLEKLGPAWEAVQDGSFESHAFLWPLLLKSS